jgi:hypothetical protein
MPVPGGATSFPAAAHEWPPAWAHTTPCPGVNVVLSPVGNGLHLMNSSIMQPANGEAIALSFRKVGGLLARPDGAMNCAVQSIDASGNTMVVSIIGDALTFSLLVELASHGQVDSSCSFHSPPPPSPSKPPPPWRTPWPEAPPMPPAAPPPASRGKCDHHCNDGHMSSLEYCRMMACHNCEQCRALPNFRLSRQ